jgi:bacillopeptidase F
VIKVLGTKSGASSGFGVSVDAFVTGGATAQESDPKVQLDAWKATSQAGATNGTYRSSATAASTMKVAFAGTAIDWITAKGKAYGKAQVKIDGVNKGTFDLYQPATAWQAIISFTGLSSGTHTLTILVTGQKSGAATGKTVVVDGFVVHG